MEIKERRVFRTNSILGISVKTPAKKKIGEVEELVIDLNSGKVAYVAVSFGGFFGFGDKFFAVPWEEFSFVKDETENYLVVDTSAEKLKHLPGFDKEDWPDIATTNWDHEVDKHFQTQKPPAAKS